MSAPPLPLTVIVPTAGRADLVARCVASLSACDPPAGEIVVVDQSGDPAVAALASPGGTPPVRIVASHGMGIAANVNAGLAAAVNDTVAITHDDCTVPVDWAATAVRHHAAAPDALVTGQVLPAGDPARVPSIRVDPEPRDHVDGRRFDVLMASNLVADRTLLLALGGFDERPGFRRAGEDFDLCWRWTSAGGAVLHRPDLVVTHHEWRSDAELVATYRRYARAKGVFYAKHLLAGDREMLRFAAGNLRGGLRALASRVVRGRPAWSDHRRALLVGVPVGLVVGAVEELRARRTGRGV